MNPIRKMISGGGAFSTNGFIPFKKWGWVCPECDKTGVPRSTYYSSGGNSRKTAKDALHEHQQTHGAPGLGV